MRLAAIVQNPVGHGAHQADVPAAVEEPDAALSEQASEGSRGFGEGRVCPSVRSAVDGDG
jgi:hypothetical protein